jgi:hypothetical protein
MLFWEWCKMFIAPIAALIAEIISPLEEAITTAGDSLLKHEMEKVIVD